VFPGFNKVKAKLTRPLMKRYLHFGLYSCVASAGNLIIGHTDTVLITLFLTLGDVGLYQVALPVAMLLAFFSITVANVVMPMTSEMYAKKDYGSVRSTIIFLQKYVFVLVVPAALLFFFFPEILIRIFFGEKFLPGADALRVLVFGSLVYSVSVINQNVFYGIGKPQMTTQNLLAAAAVNLALNLMLIPLYGIIGAAIATSTSYVALLLMSTIRLNRLIKLRYPWKTWVTIAACGAAFAFTVGVIKAQLSMHWIAELIITGATGAAVYGLLLVLFKVVDADELKSILLFAIEKTKAYF
jgi:O-antigen/teichoic acid export membrane protein